MEEKFYALNSILKLFPRPVLFPKKWIRSKMLDLYNLDNLTLSNITEFQCSEVYPFWCHNTLLAAVRQLFPLIFFEFALKILRKDNRHLQAGLPASTFIPYYYSVPICIPIKQHKTNPLIYYYVYNFVESVEFSATN